MLGMLSPVLGTFFGHCIYFTDSCQPASLGGKLADFAVADCLFTFITLCGVGLIASANVGFRSLRLHFEVMSGGCDWPLTLAGIARCFELHDSARIILPMPLPPLAVRKIKDSCSSALPFSAHFFVAMVME